MFQGEEAVRAERDWFRAALSSIGDAVIVTDPEGRVVFLNPVAESLTGWAQADAASKPLPAVFTIVNEETRQPVADPLARVLPEGVVVGLPDHTVLIARDGTERPLDDSAAPIRDDAGRIVGVVLIFREITERRRVAQAVNVSEIRYRRLFETAQDGILIFDADRRQILDANPFLTAMLGYSHAELEGKELWEIGLFKDIETSKTAFTQLQETGYIRYEDLPLQTKDGRHIDVEFVSNVYPVDGRRIIQCNIRDITARKRAEDALREAHAELGRRVEERTAELAGANEALKAEIEGHKQAKAARMELLRQLVIAQEGERHRLARELHDQMGQHLAALSLGFKVVKDVTPKSSPAHARLQQLQQLADLIGKEVHHLALELRPTALDDLGLHTALVNYVEKWSERSGVEVDFHSSGLDGQRVPPPIETALYRIVQEGLTNVFKHAQARRVSLILQRFPGQVHAVLEDDGRGFDAEAVINAAGPAGRLGLLGMRERVDLVGGTLTIEATPGRGTTIFARIPLPANGREDGDGEAACLPGR